MRMKLVTSLALMFSLGLVSSAMGVADTQADYNTNENFQHSLSGSLNGTLTGDTDGATHDGLVPATVSGGSLHAGANHNSGVQYDGGADQYFSIVENTTWGSNTIYGLVTMNSPGAGTRHFATVGYDSTSQNSNINGLRFVADNDGTQAVRLELFEGYSGALIALGIGDLIVDKEVFIAASWRDNGDGTLNMSAYIQSLDGLQAATLLGATEDRFFSGDVGGKTLNAPNDWTVQNLFVGRDSRRFTTAPAIGALNGDVNFFGINSSYVSTQAGYEALFTAIPEPMTLTLLAVGGLLSVRRRRS